MIINVRQVLFTFLAACLCVFAQAADDSANDIENTVITAGQLATRNIKITHKFSFTAPSLPTSGSSFGINMTIYSSFGQSSGLGIIFSKVTKNHAGEHVWKITARAAGEIDIVREPYASGMPIVFNSDGTLASINGDSTTGAKAPELKLVWHGAAADSAININIGKVGSSDGICLANSFIAQPIVHDGAPIDLLT